MGFIKIKKISHENRPSNSNALHEIPDNNPQGDSLHSKYNYTQSHVNQQNSPTIKRCTTSDKSECSHE